MTATCLPTVAGRGTGWAWPVPAPPAAPGSAAIDEAHRCGPKFTGHLCPVTYPVAAALGIDNPGRHGEY